MYLNILGIINMSYVLGHKKSMQKQKGSKGVKERARKTTKNSERIK